MFNITGIAVQHEQELVFNFARIGVQLQQEYAKDAPMNFLTEREQIIVNKDGGLRQGLYCMLLSSKFSEAIQNKSVFLQHSLKFSFDKK